MQAWKDRKVSDMPAQTDPLMTWLTSELGYPDDVSQLLVWMERVSLQPGEVLFNEGGDADSVYLALQGSLLATMDASQSGFTVRSIQAGGTVGEMGVYRERMRGANVRAEVPAEVLRMTRHTLAEIEAPCFGDQTAPSVCTLACNPP